MVSCRWSLFLGIIKDRGLRSFFLLCFIMFGRYSRLTLFIFTGLGFFLKFPYSREICHSFKVLYNAFKYWIKTLQHTKFLLQFSNNRKKKPRPVKMKRVNLLYLPNMIKQRRKKLLNPLSLMMPRKRLHLQLTMKLLLSPQSLQKHHL
jgi:hypothetical protein